MVRRSQATATNCTVIPRPLGKTFWPPSVPFNAKIRKASLRPSRQNPLRYNIGNGELGTGEWRNRPQGKNNGTTNLHKSIQIKKRAFPISRLKICADVRRQNIWQRLPMPSSQHMPTSYDFTFPRLDVEKLVALRREKRRGVPNIHVSSRHRQTPQQNKNSRHAARDSHTRRITHIRLRLRIWRFQMKPNTQDCVRCRGRRVRFRSSPVSRLWSARRCGVLASASGFPLASAR